MSDVLSEAAKRVNYDLYVKEVYAKNVRKAGEFMIKNADMFVEGIEKDATLEFKVVIDQDGPHITLTKEFDI